MRIFCENFALQMENENVLRIQSAMVIFALEKELGEVVKTYHRAAEGVDQSGAVQKILKRGNASGQPPDIDQIIAASYLEEIINLAATVRQNDSGGQDMKKLATLAAGLEVFAIRNAVSHPNRPFPDCYWYRTAAIASDPVIEQLGFKNVRMALQAAERGELTVPPDEWMHQRVSFVANNLPEEIEHEMTGLVGRQHEAKELEAFLKKRRHGLIAVLAPGGTGKTALILDVLKRASLEPKSQDWTSGILFCSLKQESLTAEGIVEHIASKTIQDLKLELTRESNNVFPELDIDSFEDVCDTLKDKKIVLCIDNLETLLRDDPKLFLSFYEDLPNAWQVIVTSRNTVDSAKTISLKPLTEDSAKGLASRYFSARGVTTTKTEVVEKVASAGKNNPLAIRLTIDRYVKGHPILEAASDVQAEIVSFSYKNLLEVLSNTAIRILECLFVCGTLDRATTANYLDLDEDQVAQGIRDLMATSLALRDDNSDGELIDISPSVRDLLREYPCDIGVRKQVRQAAQEHAITVTKHKSIQKSLNTSRFSEYYVDDSSPRQLGALLVKCIRLLNSEGASHSQFIGMSRQMAKFYSANLKNTQYLTLLGRLYTSIGDDVQAETEYKKAINCAGDSPVACLSYGEFLLGQNRPEEAELIFRTLHINQWTSLDKSDAFTAIRVWKGLFKVLSELGKFEDLEGLASLASGPDELKILANSYCATAIIGSSHTHDQTRSAQALLNASALLANRPNLKRRDITFIWRGAVRLLFTESKHLIDVSGDVYESYIILVEAWRNLSIYFEEVFEDTRDRKLNPQALIKAFRNITVPENPFSSREWAMYCGDEDFIEDLAHWRDKGYKLAKVTRVPEKLDVPAFVFAETEMGSPLFIHRSSCENLDWVKWSRLLHGSKVLYRSVEMQATPGKYPVAMGVILL
jgi:tetratricopeptide (TPR) repeat protein